MIKFRIWKAKLSYAYINNSDSILKLPQNVQTKTARVKKPGTTSEVVGFGVCCYGQHAPDTLPRLAIETQRRVFIYC